MGARARREWSFHPNIRWEYANKGIKRWKLAGWFTDQDEKLVREYVAELQAQKQISNARALKLSFTLVQWRRFLPHPYHDLSYSDIIGGLTALREGKSTKGKPFSKNSLHDYIRILKTFLLWMIENKGLEVPEKKIRKIQVPPVDTDTTHPEDILTYDEILALLKVCPQDRDRALISTLYESGCRIGELGTLTWRDVVFDEYGVRLYITDKKTKKRRYSRLTMSTGYLASWKNGYPGTPEGDAPVFLNTQNGLGMEYHAMRALLERILERAKLKKRVHAHLFRKSRITHMIEQNYQESIIKESIWGNVNTEQFRTYVKLSENAIDNEFLTRAGIKPKEEEKDRPLTHRTCGVCHFQNGPTILYCGKCGASLTKKAERAYEGKVKEARSQDDFERIVDETVHRILKEIGSTKSR